MSNFILIKLIKIFLATPVLAQTVISGKSVTIQNPLQGKTVIKILQDITGFFIGIGGFIAAAVVVYAGFQFLFSGGDPQKVNNAKRIIIYAIIGYAIIILSWGIIRIIQQLLGIPPTF